MAKARLVFSLSVFFIFLIGYYDHMTGVHVSMMLVYAVPVFIAAKYCGKWEGITVAVCAALSWMIVNALHMGTGESEAILSWNAFSRLAIFCLIAYTVSLQTKLRWALERERLKADSDRLTGLLNKEAFRERVEEELNMARRYKHPFSLAFIDLDNFKQINDIHGHIRGDKLLNEVSKTIKRSIRKTDIAGRIGGDEFAVFFPETDEKQVRKAIEQLVAELDIMTSQSGWQVTASIGVVSCSEVLDTFDVLLGKADKLMYLAKVNGKNSVEYLTIYQKFKPKNGNSFPH